MSVTNYYNFTLSGFVNRIATASRTITFPKFSYKEKTAMDALLLESSAPQIWGVNKTSWDAGSELELQQSGDEDWGWIKYAAYAGEGAVEHYFYVPSLDAAAADRTLDSGTYDGYDAINGNKDGSKLEVGTTVYDTAVFGSRPPTFTDEDGQIFTETDDSDDWGFPYFEVLAAGGGRYGQHLVVVGHQTVYYSTL